MKLISNVEKIRKEKRREFPVTNLKKNRSIIGVDVEKTVNLNLETFVFVFVVVVDAFA